MDKKILCYLSLFLVVLVGGTILMRSINKHDTLEVSSLDANVVSMGENTVTVLDSNNIIYTLEVSSNNLIVGDKILIEYTGLLDKNTEIQDVSVINYSISKVSQDELDNNAIYNLEDDIKIIKEKVGV